MWGAGGAGPPGSGSDRGMNTAPRPKVWLWPGTLRELRGRTLTRTVCHSREKPTVRRPLEPAEDKTQIAVKSPALRPHATSQRKGGGCFEV